MPIDSREKRQSALAFLVPTFVPGVEPDSPSVEEPERQASFWDYSGILAGYPVPPAVLCGAVAIGPVVLATLMATPFLLAEVSSRACEEMSTA